MKSVGWVGLGCGLAFLAGCGSPDHDGCGFAHMAPAGVAGSGAEGGLLLRVPPACPTEVIDRIEQTVFDAQPCYIGQLTVVSGAWNVDPDVAPAARERVSAALAGLPVPSCFTEEAMLDINGVDAEAFKIDTGLHRCVGPWCSAVWVADDGSVRLLYEDDSRTAEQLACMEDFLAEQILACHRGELASRESCPIE